MRLALKAIAATAMLALSGAASAAITWDWSFNGGPADSGSGTLTTNGLSSGSYLITSVSGVWDGRHITGLNPVNTSSYSPQNDNLLLNSGPQLDSGGFDFGVAGRAGENIYYTGSSYYVVADHFPALFVAGTFVATQAPEIDPNFAASGVALLVGGLFVLRGRRQKGVAV